MKVLVLGGTQFVGRHIVETLVAVGHSVSVLNRGRSADDLPAQIERIRGDRDEGLAGLESLTGRTWDVCVDVSGYTVRQVRSSVEKLHRSVRRYVFVSAVSVYGDPPFGPVLETQPRLAPASDDVFEVTGETYGPLKVACENIVQDVFEGRCTLLRPQVVAGPYDPLDRFSYWVRRARSTQDRAMLVPGNGSDYLQVIDARDVARFTMTACEQPLGGAFNLAGPRLTWAEFVTLLGAQNIVWVSNEVIRAAGLTEFELPLFRLTGGPRSSLMHVSNDLAVRAGLTLTDLAITARDVRDWILSTQLPSALSPEREAAVISRFRSGV